jgi:hypothetical protein
VTDSVGTGGRRLRESLGTGSWQRTVSRCGRIRLWALVALSWCLGCAAEGGLGGGVAASHTGLLSHSNDCERRFPPSRDPLQWAAMSAEVLSSRCRPIAESNRESGATCGTVHEVSPYLTTLLGSEEPCLGVAPDGSLCPTTVTQGAPLRDEEVALLLANAVHLGEDEALPSACGPGWPNLVVAFWRGDQFVGSVGLGSGPGQTAKPGRWRCLMGWS